MYLAELHNKLKTKDEDSEDLLTSNVFGFLKYDSTRLFLQKLLDELGIPVSIDGAKQAVFDFWYRFDDNTEPDLVIQAGMYYIVIEAKYKSGYSLANADIKHQIEREMTEGRKKARQKGMTFRYITITDHSCRPEEQFTLVKEYTESTEFIWCNWQRVTKLLSSIETIDIMASDLLDLLIKKKLRSYYGYGDWDLSNKLEPTTENNLFFNIEDATYRGVFMGFDHLLDLTPVVLNTSHMFFDMKHLYFSNLKPIPKINPTLDKLFWEHYE